MKQSDRDGLLAQIARQTAELAAMQPDIDAAAQSVADAKKDVDAAQVLIDDATEAKKPADEAHAKAKSESESINANAAAIQSGIDACKAAILADALTEPEVLAVPQIISRKQLMLALYEIGTKDTQVIEILEASPEPQRTILLITFKESAEFKRGSEFITVLGAGLRLSSEDIDALFVAAAKL